MLEHFFQPKSIAVIGAAREEHKIGHDILKNIIGYGFSGKIYPINPKADSVLGLKAYPSVNAVAGGIDLAVIVVPADLTFQVIDECARKGIDSAVIITAGFKESGSEGAARERELLERVHRYNIRTIGPNCFGVINTHHRLNTTFSHGHPPAGNIAFFSQSGAVCTAILDWALTEHIGFSKFISTGNNMDINEVDLLKALEDDPETRVILGYIEGIKDGRAFMETAFRVTKKKPVILIKAGSSVAGARAVSSHTGSLAGSENAVNAAFRQSGVLRANSLQELFVFAEAFSLREIPQGPSVALFTNAGGPGILASDVVERSNLKMASFSKETIDGLRRCLPPIASIYNPVDTIADTGPERYRTALELVLKDDNVHSVITMLAPIALIDERDIARVVGELAGKYKRKTVVASFLGGLTMKPAVDVLAGYGIPNYRFPENAVRAVDMMYRQRQWTEKVREEPEVFKGDRGAVSAVFSRARERGHLTLAEGDAREVVAAYGFRLPKSVLAAARSSAVEAAEEIGYPVVLKVASPDILHKSDIRGVRLGLEGPDEVGRAFESVVEGVRRRVPGVHIDGVFVQEMVQGGREVILGVSHDAQFGHLIMFGLGGIYVEMLKDVSFRVAPLTKSDAWEMVKEIRSYPLLKGARGEGALDVDAVVEGIQRISQLVVDFPEILELDINPLVVLPHGSGVVAIDARATIAPG
ncbi:MAG: acyl-CoA synthetase [Planctomycetes bacterium RIFCSPHIGHO2_02_FULL_50_42]|nr:MAG: acyl-CoA synthetase [Planctomycetes bacterium GWA2_50_13]OHB88344.1 MAG: acyl-CoA synthetase [Planctomycetes bacterium RIFCSPHIGHO2_02_FULL_50_42]OHB92869.1 MAG: acyl-CoA synthetase [Planctomycetes bacterium RIFCSPHIGHO2_12_FULL_51_37]OHB94981.1 MAG: acyl-CoA synthetase [Planctomycetes bacterium RIFCSPLOWO2_02_FULL_50_16]OHC04351.1 MAG: acyl-CoA synthetase [Planctomycetes bacterium RIFCSPLOWO2_12_FULL_50_35]HCN20185.1 acyl-CoA synthetase [Planctomycetia bacterium]